MALGQFATSDKPTPHGTSNREDAARQGRIVLRPGAGPLPLAFAAFGVGSLVFALQQLNVIKVQEAPSVELLLTVFLAPLQLIAAFYAFWARETLAATGLCMLAVTWPATLVVSESLPVGATSPVLGA